MREIHLQNLDRIPEFLTRLTTGSSEAKAWDDFDINLGLSLGGGFHESSIEKPLTRSFLVTGSIDLNDEDSCDLGKYLSLETSGSPSLQQGDDISVRHFNKHLEGTSETDMALLCSPPNEIMARGFVAAEKNPALNRALARIKAAGGYNYFKRKRMVPMGAPRNRKISTSMIHVNGDNLSPENLHEHVENGFPIFSEKTKEAQLSDQDELERSDLNLGLSLCEIPNENLKSKPLTRSSVVTARLMNPNEDVGEPSTLLSLVTSCAMQTDSVGKEKTPKANIDLMTISRIKIAALEVSVEQNPALKRALASIKATDGRIFRKRLRMCKSYIDSLTLLEPCKKPIFPQMR